MQEKEKSMQKQTNLKPEDASQIRKRVLSIIEELCMTTVKNDDQTLLGDLAFDSLRMVLLLIALEDSFGIELEESDMNPFALNTVCDVICLVEKYVSYKLEVK